MYENFKLVISDINIYGLCIFLPSLLALIFTAIFRNDKKKLKIILAALPSIVLCYLLFVCSFTFIYFHNLQRTRNFVRRVNRSRILF